MLSAKNLSFIGILVAMTLYEALVVVLLNNELSASSFRATDRVLILLTLIFLPVLLLIAGRILGGSSLINLKLPGNLEIAIKSLEKKVIDTEKRQEATDAKVEQQAVDLEQQLIGKLSTAEQTLYPLIGGPDAFAQQRLKNNTVILGSKDFAANIVVAELLAQHLEFHGIHVIRRIPNGGTITNYACLINGWIDVFIDYTGTGCLFMNVPYRGETTDNILKQLNRISTERYQFEWLTPLGTKTNYCLVMSEEHAKRQGITRISQVAEKLRGKLHFCSNYEFMNRLDGLPGLKDFYNLKFSEETICNYNERYQFVYDGKAEISVGHTTDSQINELGLLILEDDKGFFPDYFETPIARNEALEYIPKLRDIMTEFSNFHFTNDEITALIQDYSEHAAALASQVQLLLHRKR